MAANQNARTLGENREKGVGTWAQRPTLSLANVCVCVLASAIVCVCVCELSSPNKLISNVNSERTTNTISTEDTHVCTNKFKVEFRNLERD